MGGEAAAVPHDGSETKSPMLRSAPMPTMLTKAAVRRAYWECPVMDGHDLGATSTGGAPSGAAHAHVSIAFGRGLAHVRRAFRE